MYHFRSLQEISLHQLVECINLSFSDYEQTIHFTTETLKYFLTSSNVNLSLSFGAFLDEQPIAFILNSNGIYNNQRVIFDAGTGVVPEHRGKKVFSLLFEYAIQQMKHLNFEKYYLEVLQTNHKAISIYSKKGFTILREYSVLKSTRLTNNKNNYIDVVPYQNFDIFSTAFLVEPSFEHISYIINKNPQHYEVIYLDKQAYCIYAKKSGEIIQMHYNQLDALKEIMFALINRYPTVIAKNVDCSCCEVIQMLMDIGFVEITKQYEMVKSI